MISVRGLAGAGCDKPSIEDRCPAVDFGRLMMMTINEQSKKLT